MLPIRPEEPNQFKIIETIVNVQKALVQPFKQTPGFKMFSFKLSKERRARLERLSSAADVVVVVVTVLKSSKVVSSKYVVVSSGRLLELDDRNVVVVVSMELVMRGCSKSELMVVDFIKGVDVVVGMVVGHADVVVLL